MATVRYGLAISRSTASRMTNSLECRVPDRSGTSSEFARAMSSSERRSLGRQEPPKANPGVR